MNQKPKLDQVDLLIITQMLEDAKMSYADLGQKIFVSGADHRKLYPTIRKMVSISTPT
jgi:hypothetical protein